MSGVRADARGLGCGINECGSHNSSARGRSRSPFEPGHARVASRTRSVLVGCMRSCWAGEDRCVRIRIGVSGDFISHNRGQLANSALGSSPVPEFQDSPGRQGVQAGHTTKRNCVLRSSASLNPLDHEWPILLTCRFWPNLNTYAWIPTTRAIVNIGLVSKSTNCQK